MTDLPPPDANGASRRSGRGILTVLGALLIVVLVVVGYQVWRLTDLTETWYNPFSSGQTVVSDSDRKDAVTVAEQFSIRMDAIDSTNTEEYVKKVGELLTQKQRAKFEEEFQQFQELGNISEQGDVKGEGKILASGVSTIDDRRAIVLVAHDANITSPQGTTARHYRWVITLVKVSGDWLVDDFTPAGA